MSTMETVQNITIPFPVSLLTELRQFVPQQDYSQFIVKATARELKRERLTRVLQKLRERPAWSLTDHPDLATVEDVDRYVRAMRETWMPRSWDEIMAEAMEEMADN